VNITNLLKQIEANSVTRDNRVVLPCKQCSFRVEMLREPMYNFLWEQENIVDIDCELIHDGVAHDVQFTVRADDGFFALEEF